MFVGCSRWHVHSRPGTLGHMLVRLVSIYGGFKALWAGAALDTPAVTRQFLCGDHHWILALSSLLISVVKPLGKHKYQARHTHC